MSYQKLREVIDPNSPKAIYLALQPQHYRLAIKQLIANDLLNQDSNLILEKPLALSQSEGIQLLKLLQVLGIENQTQLVEHFNLKEVIANTTFLRQNTPFGEFLKPENIVKIRIYALEKITVPSERVQFFDSVGSQLKDMITHLLAMVYPLLVELKPGLELSQLRESKDKIAKSWRVVGESIWGQYEGYPTSTTSTFTACILECEIGGKKIQCEFVTGKGLPEKYCAAEVISNNKSRLVLRHYPNEGIAFYFPVKRPGAGRELVPAKMEFTYESAFQQANQPAYLRLLSDILAGDKSSSFASPFEALQALRIADTFLQKDCVPSSFVKYDIGTYPEAAKDWLPSEWG